MRKTLGTILLGLSSFLLVTALLGWFYAPGSTQRTPLNVSSLTQLEGTGTYLSKGPAPVKATSQNVINGAKSDGSTAVFTATTCLWFASSPTACPAADAADTGLINAGADTFATDRHTAMSVQQATYKHEGLVNKFPFYPEKKAYQFWDGVLEKAVQASFQAEETVQGLKTKKYVISFADQTAEIADGVTGTYSDDKTMWVDAASGSIINQTDHQVRKLDTGDTALDLNLAFTDAQVATNVKDAKANGSKLSAVKKLPIIAIVLAALAALGGVVLLTGQRGTATAADAGASGRRRA